MMSDSGTTEPRHGLGLLIVGQIVSAHKGTVSFDHGKQGGFSVTISFPISRIIKLNKCKNRRASMKALRFLLHQQIDFILQVLQNTPACAPSILTVDWLGWLCYSFLYDLCLVGYLWLIARNTFIEVWNAKNTAMKMFIKTIAANIMATIFQIRRERRFLIASCSFILDNCSATSLAVFSFSIFAPSNSLTDTSNISASRIRVSASGTD